MPVPSLQQLAVQKVPRQDLRRLLQSADVLPESLVFLIREALKTLQEWKAKFRPARILSAGSYDNEYKNNTFRVDSIRGKRNMPFAVEPSNWKRKWVNPSKYRSDLVSVLNSF